MRTPTIIAASFALGLSLIAAPGSGPTTYAVEGPKALQRDSEPASSVDSVVFETKGRVAAFVIYAQPETKRGTRNFDFVPPTLVVRDLAERRIIIEKAPGIPGPFRAIAISEGGAYVVLGSVVDSGEANGIEKIDGGSVLVWDLKTGKRVGKKYELGEPVVGLHLDEPGENVTAVGWSGAISRWRIQTGQVLFSFEGHKAPTAVTRSLADREVKASFSADGRCIAAVIRGARIRDSSLLKLCDLSADKSKAFETPIPNARCVAVSPGGDLVALGFSDQSDIQLWDFKKREGIRWLAPGVCKRTDVIAFSQNGMKILAGHEDGSVEVWNARSGIAGDRIPGEIPACRVRAIWSSEDLTRIVRGGFETEEDFKNPRPDGKSTILPLTIQDVR